MRRNCSVAVLGLAILSLAGPAYACRDDGLVLTDVRIANVVVAGRISNYEVVGDPRDVAAASKRDKLLREALKATAEQMRDIRRQNNFRSDYARFDILVDEVLIGNAPQTLTVTWDNRTSHELEFMPPGPYLIALRDPKSTPRGDYSPSPSPVLMTVLQAGCASGFIFETTSKEAAELRRILGAGAK